MTHYELLLHELAAHGRVTYSGLAKKYAAAQRLLDVPKQAKRRVAVFTR
jgi:hypothetical protein